MEAAFARPLVRTIFRNYRKNGTCHIRRFFVHIYTIYTKINEVTTVCSLRSLSTEIYSLLSIKQWFHRGLFNWKRDQQVFKNYIKTTNKQTKHLSLEAILVTSMTPSLLHGAKAIRSATGIVSKLLFTHVLFQASEIIYTKRSETTL